MSPRRAPAARRVAWMVLVALLLLLAPAFARAWTRPEVAASFGGTFAVLGSTDGGGSSASLALLWPVTRDARFGFMVHADDAGSVLTPALTADSTLVEVETAHRMAIGASWRLDVERRWRKFIPFASATLGYSKVADDVRGRRFAHVGSAGFSLGAGTRVAVSPHVAVGASVRYHRLFNDREGRFVSAGLDLSWR